LAYVFLSEECVCRRFLLYLGVCLYPFWVFGSHEARVRIAPSNYSGQYASFKVPVFGSKKTGAFSTPCSSV
jgi:hypothetical protein